MSPCQLVQPTAISLHRPSPSISICLTTLGGPAAGSSSHELESQSDREVSSEPEIRPLKPSAQEARRVVPVTKQRSAAASAAAATGTQGKQTDQQPKRQKPDNVSASDAKRQKAAAANGTPHLVNAAHSSESEDSEAASKQDTSTGSKQLPKQEQSQQHSKQQVKQQSQQKTGKGQRRQMEALSGSDTGNTPARDVCSHTPSSHAVIVWRVLLTGPHQVSVGASCKDQAYRVSSQHTRLLRQLSMSPCWQLAPAAFPLPAVVVSVGVLRNVSSGHVPSARCPASTRQHPVLSVYPPMLLLADDMDSDDEDIAEYKREMMLGRHVSNSSSDDDKGVGDDSDAGSGSEGGPELQVEEVERWGRLV